MSGRQSAEVAAALKEAKRHKKPNVYAIAKRHGVAASSLYRALKTGETHGR